MMSNLDFKPFYSKALPHIQPPGAILFVTYRLAGSIPQAVVRQLLQERATREREIMRLTDSEKQRAQLQVMHKQLFGQWDTVLDKGKNGPMWLREQAVAQIVADSLHYLDGERYTLDCYTIMSNHVHVVFQPLEEADGAYHALPRIMHSLKGFTATKANRLLGRSGAFWQHESYDHVVRNEDALHRIRRYILDNPVKAGLIDDPDEWPWSYASWA